MKLGGNKVPGREDRKYKGSEVGMRYACLEGGE